MVTFVVENVNNSYKCEIKSQITVLQSEIVKIDSTIGSGMPKNIGLLF